MSEAPRPSGLTLVVPGIELEDAEAGLDAVAPAGAPVLGSRLFHRTETIPDLAGVRAGLERVEGELDELFRGVWDRPAGGMHLRQIQVGLAVTTEGSIGIASAGAQVSLTLVYQREQADGDGVG
jgi:hypothetical protein